MPEFSLRKSTANHAWPGLVGVLSFALLATTAAADDDSRFSLSAGVFLTNWDSATQVNLTNTDTGDTVDLESDLGLDKSDSVFRIDGYYKFNDTHRVDFSAFNFSRSATRVIDREIEWQGDVYPVNTTVTAESDLQVYKLGYTYSFMRRDKGYLGVTGGLYVADIRARLAAENIDQRSGGSVTAPLPVIGARGEYRLSDKWTARASAEFFFIDYQDYTGSLTDLYAGVDYRLFGRAAIGVAYNSVRLDIGIDKSTLNSNLNWRYDGGLLFLKYDF